MCGTRGGRMPITGTTNDGDYGFAPFLICFPCIFLGVPQGDLGPLASLWTPLGGLREALGSPWGPRGGPWGLLGLSGSLWEAPGAPERPLGASGRPLEPPGDLWEPLGNPWSLLGLQTLFQCFSYKFKNIWNL